MAELAGFLHQHPFTQEVVHLDDRLALHRFSNDEVDFAIGGVGEEVKVGRMPFGRGIPDEADVFTDGFTSVVGPSPKGHFGIAFVLVLKDVDGVTETIDNACTGWLKIP